MDGEGTQSSRLGDRGQEVEVSDVETNRERCRRRAGAVVRAPCVVRVSRPGDRRLPGPARADAGHAAARLGADARDDEDARADDDRYARGRRQAGSAREGNERRDRRCQNSGDRASGDRAREATEDNAHADGCDARTDDGGARNDDAALSER